jgi:hypothetical protein
MATLLSDLSRPQDVSTKLAPIISGATWTFKFLVSQNYSPIIGGTGADGVASFDGTNTPAHCTKDGKLYTLTANTNYSICTLSNNVELDTAGFTLNTQSLTAITDYSVIVSPYDFTGYTFGSQIRPNFGATGTPLFDFAPIVPSGSTFTLTIPYGSTAALQQASAQLAWDFFVYVGSVRKDIMIGSILTKQSVTI